MPHGQEISRREFVRFASAGAVAGMLVGCGDSGRNFETARPPQVSAAAAGPSRVDREAFRRLADLAIGASSGDHTLVLMRDADVGTTQFTDNRIVANEIARSRLLTVSVAFGNQHASADVDEFSEHAVRDAVTRAEMLAKRRTEDAGYLPPLAPRHYPVLPTLRADTAAADRARRAADVARVIELCETSRLIGEGNLTTSVTAVGVAADTGLFAYEQRSRALFSVIVHNDKATGWAGAANRSIDDLGVVECTERASYKARRSAGPRELASGTYTLIFEPSALADLLAPLLDRLEADNAALADKLGKPIMDQRLTLQNRPDHPSLLGNGFDDRGLQSDSRKWIDKGVLRQVHGGQPLSYALDAVHLSGAEPAGETVESLIKTTERGLLVTGLTDVRQENLTLTAATRGGTFLIEDGEIAAGVKDLRFSRNLIEAFNSVEAFTTPADALSSRRRKMMLPAMKIRGFEIS